MINIREAGNPSNEMVTLIVVGKDFVDISP